MKELFGTDGMRGKAGEFPLDEQTIFTLGKSLAKQFAENLGRPAKFITGRDTRESGDWIELAFHAGAKSEDAHCESAEIITTPGVAFLTKQFEFDAGIVLSASHNPFEDNGIKIFLPSGKKLNSETERRIEKDIHNESWAVVNNQWSVDFSRAEEFQAAYLDYLAEEFKDLSLCNFKMVIDCANGASSHLAAQLFERFGAEVIALDCEPDGQNINENCGSTHLEKLFRANKFDESHLRRKMLEENADFGVAFDGDADRALFVDEQGNFVDGDATLWIMAQFLEAHGLLANRKIIATVMSNLGLETALKAKNIELIRTDVGDKYVLEELLKTDSAVGGEQSGHIIFPRKSLVGDGMMTTLYLLETLFENKKSLSEMTAGFTRFPQILVGVKVREKTPFEQFPKIVNTAAEIENQLGEKGRLLLRYSGTENLARVMIEGENQTTIESQANGLADVIRASLG